MKKRKWIAIAAMMSACMFFPVSVKAQEEETTQTSSLTIKTQVPDTHKAVLTIIGNGSVMINGETCKGETSILEVNIPRLTETKWQFSPADGYTLDEVYLNEIDVSDKVVDNIYWMDPVNADGTEVKVVFTKVPASLSDTTGNPDTGVNRSAGLWVTVMIGSALLAMGFVAIKRRKRV